MRRLLCLLALAAATAATAAARNSPPPDSSRLPANLTVGEAGWTHAPLIFENAFMANPRGGGGRNVPSRDPGTPTHVASARADARGRFADRGRGRPDARRARPT